MAVAAREVAPQPLSPPAGRPALRLVPAPRVSRAVYRRRRLAVLSVITLLVLGAWAVAGLATAPPSYLDAPATRTVVVGEGDTLWWIAARHAPAGEDLRGYIDEVRSLNGVEARALVPGSVLRLP
jgi:hypothetical protein